MVKGCAINYKMAVPDVHVQSHVTRLNHANKTSRLKGTKSKFHLYSNGPEVCFNRCHSNWQL